MINHNDDELVTAYQKGDERAGEQLLKNHMGFVIMIVRRMKKPRYVTEDELMAIAMERFMRACKVYDTNRYNKLVTLCGCAMKRKLWHYIWQRTKSRWKVDRKQLNGEQYKIPVHETRSYTELDYKELIEKINSIKSITVRATMHEKLKGKTFSDIARKEGLSVEAIRLRYLKGLKLLKEMYNEKT